MLRLGLRVRVMAIITLLAGHDRVWQIVTVLEARSQIVQDETHQVVVRVRLPIRFNLETAVGREKAVQTIYVHREFLQLVVTLRVKRDC